MDGNTDNEKRVKTRGNLKSTGCSGRFTKSYLGLFISKTALLSEYKYATSFGMLLNQLLGVATGSCLRQ